LIKLLTFITAVCLLSSTLSIAGFTQINLESFGQTNTTAETKRGLQDSESANADMASINITKNVQCDSSLGIPSDDSVCQFVLTNVDAGQFSLEVLANQSNSTSFQGSSNGTIISVFPGNYTVTEDPFDPMDIENQLGENAIVTVLSDANGDCTGQFDQLDTFQQASGSVQAGETHSCEIINTISVSQGASPEEP
jgi:hypothetical protein